MINVKKKYIAINCGKGEGSLINKISETENLSTGSS